MNPKNPQAASEGLVLVPREQLSSLADILHDNRTTTDSGLPVTVLECIDVAQAAATEIRRLLAASPAIAPGGDAEVMRKVLDMLQSGLWEDAEDFLEAHVTALPAPANAVTVDDAAVKRFTDSFSVHAGAATYEDRIRIALTAALAPAAAMSGKCSNYPNCPKEFCSACIPPADPLAAGEPLPPLPQAALCDVEQANGLGEYVFYTASQMRAYALAARHE